MSQQPFEPHEGNRMLTRIYEGMTVYDRASEKIGTVEHVYFGEVSREADKRGGGRRRLRPQIGVRAGSSRMLQGPYSLAIVYRTPCANASCAMASSG
jgi:hypothetical protein